jgi:hypothetical protein
VTTPESALAGARDPYQWVHDNGFTWDDVNSLAATLDAGGFDLYRVEEVERLREAAQRVLAVYDGRRHPDEDPDEEPDSGWDNWHRSLSALREALEGTPR